uniref:ARID domain-containing protein n=1 Tax=Kalanchoe fedtschenkoi TaxID=63787 RepID=A0A7N0R8B1_KALFE
MAGWSMVADEPAGGCGTVKKRVVVSEFSLDVEACKVRSLFDRYVRVVFEETGSGSSVRPFPPMLGNGRCVDLFQVFVAVRERGGCSMVTESGLWNLVAESCGLGSGVGGSLKLIYVKYLDVLERCINQIAENKNSKADLGDYGGDETGRLLSELEEDLDYLLSIITDKKNETENFGLNSLMNGDSGMFSIRKRKKTTLDADKDAEIGDCVTCKSEVMDVESGISENPDENSLNLDYNCGAEVPGAQVASNGSRIQIANESDDELNECLNVAYGDNMVQFSTNNEGFDSQKKRKRQSSFGMLNWLLEIAKDPCNPAIGHLPERPKWKSFGNEVLWKQVLSAREELFIKQKFDSKAEQEFWLRRQMHPSIYEGRTPERPRSSRRLTHANKFQLQNILGDWSQTKSDYDDSHDRQLPRIGEKYQADLPKWDTSGSESDSKWFGTKIWPLEKGEKRSFFERIPVGKGRQDGCGCPIPGSVECVRFHISEKSVRLRLELGSAFYYWRFDSMGENVACSWTADEVKEFETIVKEYHNTIELWDELRKAFPTRSRVALVSYYFNVFLLRHRADQNRHNPHHIDSDIEESEDSAASRVVDQTAEISRSSIYYSPKKQRKGNR